MPVMGVHGEGGITRTRDGRLAVRVTMSDGKRIVRMVPARLVKDDPKAAKRQAERLRRELVEARDLELDPTRRTLADYLRSWIEALREEPPDRRKRPRTLEHYAMIVERHIIPALGSLPLRSLSKRRIEAWMRTDPGARQTVRLHHGVLRNALEGAVGDLIPSNPAKSAKPPDRSDFRGSPLTFDEARALLAVPGRAASAPRVRQPGVREPGSPDARHPSRQRTRRHAEGPPANAEIGVKPGTRPPRGVGSVMTETMTREEWASHILSKRWPDAKLGERRQFSPMAGGASAWYVLTPEGWRDADPPGRDVHRRVRPATPRTPQRVDYQRIWQSGYDAGRRSARREAKR